MHILYKAFMDGASGKMLACLCCILVVGLLVTVPGPAQAQQQVPQAILDQLAANPDQAAQIAADAAKANPDLAEAIAAAATKVNPDAAGDIAVAVAKAVPDKAVAVAQAVVNAAPDKVDAVNQAMDENIPNWTNVTATQPTSTPASPLRPKSAPTPCSGSRARAATWCR